MIYVSYLPKKGYNKPKKGIFIPIKVQMIGFIDFIGP